MSDWWLLFVELPVLVHVGWVSLHASQHCPDVPANNFNLKDGSVMMGVKTRVNVRRQLIDGVKCTCQSVKK